MLAGVAVARDHVGSSVLACVVCWWVLWQRECSDLAGVDTWVCYGVSEGFFNHKRKGTMVWEGGRTSPQMGPVCHSMPWEDLSGPCLMVHAAKVPSIWRHSLPIFAFLLYIIKTSILLHICCWSFLTEIRKEPCTPIPGPGAEDVLPQGSEHAFANPASFHQTPYTEDVKGVKLWHMTVTFKPVYNQKFIKDW